MSKLTRYNGTEVANLSLGQAGITYITGGTVNAVDTCTRFVSVLILVAGSGNLVLTNDDGVAVTISTSEQGNLLGVAIPGAWATVTNTGGKIIAYRG